jgi:1-acyl-sn-glycerol-3-phosphate acyltransferase
VSASKHSAKASSRSQYRLSDCFKTTDIDNTQNERYVIKQAWLGIAMRGAVISLAGTLIVLFARFLTAVRGRWEGVTPVDEQRIYYANHASHGDFVLIWTVLPRRMRFATRPVAGSDYWLKSRLRRFIGCDVFDAVLIDRERASRTSDPIIQMTNALDAGSSLIVFPEGTRNTTDAPLLPFKSGLFHLARARPKIVLVPVWIDNLNRVMPKGEFVPIPLICTVTFGAALRVADAEEKQDFLARAEAALLVLAPKASGS